MRAREIKPPSEIKHPTLSFRGCSEDTGGAPPAFGPIVNAAGSREERSSLFLFSCVLIDFQMIAVLSRRKNRHGDFPASVHTVPPRSAACDKAPGAANRRSLGRAGREPTTTSPFGSEPAAQPAPS